MQGKAKIGKLDVDQNPKTASKLGIGKVVKQFVGVKPKHILIKEIEKYL